jgi:hypothetical protein
MFKCSKCGAEAKPDDKGASPCCGATVVAEMSATVQGVGGLKR